MNTIRQYLPGLSLLDDGDFSSFEEDGAVGEGKEGKVAADADVFAGLEGRAALANDDGTGRYFLTAADFDTEVLRVAVAAVAGRTLSFFMCHFIILQKTMNYIFGTQSVPYL